VALRRSRPRRTSRFPPQPATYGRSRSSRVCRSASTRVLGPLWLGRRLSRGVPRRYRRSSVRCRAASAFRQSATIYRPGPLLSPRPVLGTPSPRPPRPAAASSASSPSCRLPALARGTAVAADWSRHLCRRASSLNPGYDFCVHADAVRPRFVGSDAAPIKRLGSVGVDDHGEVDRLSRSAVVWVSEPSPSSGSCIYGYP